MEKQRKFITLFSDILDTSDANMEEYRKDIAICNEIEPEDVTDDDIYDVMYDEIDVAWDNITSDLNRYDEKHPDAKYTINGTLGLWWGKPTIQEVVVNSLLQAVEKCIGNDSTRNTEIKEDQYGCLYVDYHHHDGTNHFVIHKKEPNKKNINLTKEVWQ